MVRHADIEGADEAVDACGGNDGVAVFVPVVREGFGWCYTYRRGGAHARFWRRVDGDVHC